MMVVNVSGRHFLIFHSVEVGAQKNKNDIYTKVSLVGLDIKINDNRFSINLYDKQIVFPISIVKMPYLHSNVLYKIS